MTQSPNAHPLPARRWHDGKWNTIADPVSVEEALRVTWQDTSCTLMAWPGQLDDLALGHVLLDRWHLGPEDAPSQVTRRGSAHIVTALPTRDTAAQAQTNTATPTWHVTLCEDGPARLLEPSALTPQTLICGMNAFMEAPGFWDGTGGFHRAGVFDPATQQLIHLAEDIGRHNCLDRLAGFACRTGVNLSGTVLLISARITASLYAKARRAGFAYMVSRAAVTSTPVRCAMRDAVTLIGFCRTRETRFTVFADTAGRVRP